MILVSRVFAVNPNEHISRNTFMHEPRRFVFGHNFVLLLELFKEFVGNRQNQIIKWT